MNKLPFPAGMEIENFKCFGQRVTVPLAPITLLYGENSAGKSAIIQLLCMLRHTLDLGSNDPILVSRDANGLVDLGRYSDYVHDHDPELNVSVSFLSPQGYARGFTAGYDRTRDIVVPRYWTIRGPRGEYILHSHRDSLIPEPEGIIYTDVPCNHGEFLCECASKHPDLVLEGIKKTIQLLVLQQADPKGSVSMPPWDEEPFRSAYAQMEQQYKACIDLMRGAPSADDLRLITQLVSYRLYARNDGGEPRAWRPSLVAAQDIALPMLENWLLIGASNVMLAVTTDQVGYDEWSSTWGLAVREPSESKFKGRALQVHNARLHFDVPMYEAIEANLVDDNTEYAMPKEESYTNSLVFVSATQVTANIPACVIWDGFTFVDRFLYPNEAALAVLAAVPTVFPTDTLRFEHFRARRGFDPGQIRHNAPTWPGYVHLGSREEGHCQSEFTDLAEDLNYPVGVNWVTRFISIGPLRQEPARWYEVYDPPRIGVGRKGEHTAEYLRQNPDLQEPLNTWLHRLGIDYKVGVETVVPMERMPALGILKLTDLRRDNPVVTTIADVGMGISQVLPIVAECLCEKEKWIGIEQPELHIHPRLQAELGTLFVESYKQQGNHFLIETHSEHLLLRLQRLIRRGQLTADDVAVLYVSRAEDGSTVQRLRLDESGEFIDDWPGGFFEEGYNEIFGD